MLFSVIVSLPGPWSQLCGLWPPKLQDRHATSPNLHRWSGRTTRWSHADCAHGATSKQISPAQLSSFAPNEEVLSKIVWNSNVSCPIQETTLDHSEWETSRKFMFFFFTVRLVHSQDCLHEHLFAIVVFACDGNVHKPQQRVSMASKWQDCM